MTWRRVHGRCGRAAPVAAAAVLLAGGGAAAADEAPSHFPVAVGGRVGSGLPGGGLGLDVEVPVALGWDVGVAVASLNRCVADVPSDMTRYDGPSPVGCEIAVLLRMALADWAADWSVYYGASVGPAFWSITAFGWEVNGVFSSYVAWLSVGLAHDWHPVKRATLRLTTGLAWPIAVPGHAIWREVEEAFTAVNSWDNGDPVGAPIPMLALTFLVGVGESRAPDASR